jgi:hypothetical protein
MPHYLHTSRQVHHGKLTTPLRLKFPLRVKHKMETYPMRVKHIMCSYTNLLHLCRVIYTHSVKRNMCSYNLYTNCAASLSCIALSATWATIVTTQFTSSSFWAVDNLNQIPFQFSELTINHLLLSLRQAHTSHSHRVKPIL